VRAGDFTTIVVLAGSFLRPVGGWLSDKIGGYRLLLVLLCALSLCLFAVGTLPPLTAEVQLLFFTMGMLGMGNGAVFQIVPQRFPERIGILTGLVGAAGGFGGFLLPSLLGTIKDRTGQYSMGLYFIAAAFFFAALALLQLGTQWQVKWNPSSIDRAGIFSYRRLFQTRPQEIID
jgi:NNP family nitrate/nitrite transporter-like MFS transporter